MSAEQTTDGAVQATEMEDRVARLVNHPPVDDAEWAYIKRMHRHVYADWIHDARKHIRAMRDCTEHMVVSAQTQYQADLNGVGRTIIGCVWLAMIDAATAPVQESSTAAVPQGQGRHQSP